MLDLAKEEIAGFTLLEAKKTLNTLMRARRYDEYESYHPISSAVFLRAVILKAVEVTPWGEQPPWRSHVRSELEARISRG